MIGIEINGERAEVAAGENVAGLLAARDLDPRTVAIEHNGSILKRERYAATVLEAGDRLEIVRFVQGG